MISPQQAAAELLARRDARRDLQSYITYGKPDFHTSVFSRMVCDAVNLFITRVHHSERPILVLQGPPQHGKTEIASRRTPPFLLGCFPDWRIVAASYSSSLAGTIAQDVRRNLFGPEHQVLFPSNRPKNKFDVNRQAEFNSPAGNGSYLGLGVGQGVTGRPWDIGIIDDPTQGAEQALSEVSKESLWNLYQSEFSTRASKNSGQIVMATSWAEDDLPARILKHFKGDARLMHLRFPAINLPDETGYNPELPSGALVPDLKPLDFLYEQKALLSDYWWSAMYQQSPKTLGGNVFKEDGVQYYLPKDLPKTFDIIIISLDATFKDTDGSDFVVFQVWGKKGANVYLLDQVRGRMSFTATVKAAIELKNKWPQSREFLIEDKANGPAVIDTLKADIPGIIPIEPDGSKLARAHAVTSYWEAKNVFIPDPRVAPWVTEFVNELTHFPTAAHDDQVDALSQALRRLYPVHGRMVISREAIDKLKGLK